MHFCGPSEIPKFCFSRKLFLGAPSGGSSWICGGMENWFLKEPAKKSCLERPFFVVATWHWPTRKNPAFRILGLCTLARWPCQESQRKLPFLNRCEVQWSRDFTAWSTIKTEVILNPKVCAICWVLAPSLASRSEKMLTSEPCNAVTKQGLKLRPVQHPSPCTPVHQDLHDLPRWPGMTSVTKCSTSLTMAHVQQCLVSSSFSSTKKWSLLKLVHSINRMALPRCQKSESVRIMTGYAWCRFPPSVKCGVKFVWGARKSWLCLKPDSSSIAKNTRYLCKGKNRHAQWVHFSLASDAFNAPKRSQSGKVPTLSKRYSTKFWWP